MLPTTVYLPPLLNTTYTPLHLHAFCTQCAIFLRLPRSCRRYCAPVIPLFMHFFSGISTAGGTCCTILFLCRFCTQYLYTGFTCGFSSISTCTTTTVPPLPLPRTITTAAVSRFLHYYTLLTSPCHCCFRPSTVGFLFFIRCSSARRCSHYYRDWSPPRTPPVVPLCHSAHRCTPARACHNAAALR